MKNYFLLLIMMFVSGCSLSVHNGNVDLDTPLGNIDVNDGNVSLDTPIGDSSVKDETVSEKIKKEALSKSQSPISILKESCEIEYQKIIDEHGKEFNDCMGTVDDSYSCDKKEKKTNLVLIMDASGSMARTIKGQSRMEIAKTATTEFVENLKDDINFGMIVYGHKGSTAEKTISCSGIEVFTPLGTQNRNNTKNLIDQLHPVGWTPIADSLLKAQSVLSPHLSSQNNNSILLVSDGEETCDGSPAKIASSLSQSDNLTINVIGFDVIGDAENQLKNIAKNGNGQYYSARTANELNTALKNLTKVTCASAPDAWSDGFESVLTNYLDCEFRLNDESFEVSQSITFDLEKTQCKSYIQNKYAKRKQSIRAMIEATPEAGKKKLKKISPVSDESFFNQDLSDSLGDDTDLLNDF